MTADQLDMASESFVKAQTRTEFRKLDENNDKVLSKEEWKTVGSLEAFINTDRNGNGEIDTEEFACAAEKEYRSYVETRLSFLAARDGSSITHMHNGVIEQVRKDYVDTGKAMAALRKTKTDEIAQVCAELAKVRSDQAAAFKTETDRIMYPF